MNNANNRTKPAPATAGNRLQDDRLGSAIISGNSADLLARQRLDLFGARCHELVERINSGSISFIDGVDLAYSASIWAGLVDDVGDDAVQTILHDAFMGVRRP